MSDLARFGVSLEEELLEAFDEFCRGRGYSSRSEAIRDLIRGALAADICDRGGSCGGALTLIYDHHKHDLSRRLLAIQHDSHDLVVAAMHVHLDHDNCLETLVLKGESAKVADLAHRLISCRGVKYSAFNHLPSNGAIA